MNGETVPENKIPRWESRMLKNGTITENETFSDVGQCLPDTSIAQCVCLYCTGTPPGLTVRTPTLSNASPIAISESAVLQSPLADPTISFTIQSPHLQSPLPPLPEVADLVSAPSDMLEPIPDILPMEIDTQPLWEEPTSLIVSDESSLLNNILSASSSPSLCNVAISPRVLDITEFASNSAFSQLSSMSHIIPEGKEPPVSLPLSVSPNELDFGQDTITEMLFEESISRLMRFANAKGKFVESSYSSQLLNDLQTLLEYTKTANFEELECPWWKAGPDVLQELAIAHSQLSAASSVAINCKGEIHCVNQLGH